MRTVARKPIMGRKNVSKQSDRRRLRPLHVSNGRRKSTLCWNRYNVARTKPSPTSEKASLAVGPRKMSIRRRGRKLQLYLALRMSSLYTTIYKKNDFVLPSGLPLWMSSNRSKKIVSSFSQSFIILLRWAAVSYFSDCWNSRGLNVARLKMPSSVALVKSSYRK